MGRVNGLALFDVSAKIVAISQDFDSTPGMECSLVAAHPRSGSVKNAIFTAKRSRLPTMISHAAPSVHSPVFLAIVIRQISIPHPLAGHLGRNLYPPDGVSMPSIRQMLLRTIRSARMYGVATSFPETLVSEKTSRQRPNLWFTKRSFLTNLPRISLLGIRFIDELILLGIPITLAPKKLIRTQRASEGSA